MTVAAKRALAKFVKRSICECGFPVLVSRRKKPTMPVLDAPDNLLGVLTNGRTGKVLLNWMGRSLLLNPKFPPSDLFGESIRNP
jgi:hypothetical protein